MARAAPDGHTILFGYIGTHGMSPALQKLRYVPITQFEPIGMVSYSPTLMVVNPKVPAKTVSELVALTKASPTTSTTHRPATARPPTFRPRSSSWKAAPRWPMCPTVAPRLR